MLRLFPQCNFVELKFPETLTYCQLLMQSLTEDVWEFQQCVDEYQNIEYYAMFKTAYFGKSLLFNFAASISDRVSGQSFNSKSAEPTDGLSHKDEFQFKRLLKMIAWFASRPASPWTMGCDKSVFKDSLKPTFKLCVMHNNDNSSTLILGKSLTR